MSVIVITIKNPENLRLSASCYFGLCKKNDIIFLRVLCVFAVNFSCVNNVEARGFCCEFIFCLDFYDFSLIL
jgi:hypothetical protein